MTAERPPERQPTSKTLRDVLKGPDGPERRKRVAEFVEIHQPTWEKTVKWLLRHHGAKNVTLDGSDIVGDEVKKMLDPDSEYFKTYNAARSVRTWLKTCMRNQAIDFLRRKGLLKRLFISLNSPADPNSSRGEHETQEAEIVDVLESKYIAPLIDECEAYEICRVAWRITEEICGREGLAEDLEIFKAVKTVQYKLSPQERLQREWTEDREKKAVPRVWEILRGRASLEAASRVSDNPEDAAEVARECWDRIRKSKYFELPETGGTENGQVE